MSWSAGSKLKSTNRCSSGVRDLLREALHLLVKLLTALAFLLFLLNLVLVTISVLALPVDCLIELDVGRFAEELDVLKTMRRSRGMNA